MPEYNFCSELLNEIKELKELILQLLKEVKQNDKRQERVGK